MIEPQLRSELLGYLLSRGVQYHDAENILQEAAIGLVENTTYDPSRPLGPYVWEVLRNELSDHRKRNRKRREVALGDWDRPKMAPHDVDERDYIDSLPEKERSIIDHLYQGGKISDLATPRQTASGCRKRVRKRYPI